MKKSFLFLLPVLILLCFAFPAMAGETAAFSLSEITVPATAQSALEKYPLPFDAANAPRIASYTEENGLVTVQLGGDVEALVEELGGANTIGSVYYSIYFNYTLNGESLFDIVTLQPDAGIAQYQLPENAVFENRFSLLSLECSFDSIPLSISGSEKGYRLSYVEPGTSLSYGFANSGALISLQLPLPSGSVYCQAFYNETTGALEQYSYSPQNDSGFVSMTFGADQRLAECRFSDGDGVLHSWNSALGWYGYVLDEATNQYVQQPVDGPEGADVSAILPLTIEE